jgi:hypothetical protein
MKLTFVRLLVDEYAACFRFYRDVLSDGNLIKLNHALPAA